MLTDQAWNIAKNLTASGYAQCVIASARGEDEQSLEVVENVPVHRFLPSRPRWKFFRRFHKPDADSGEIDLPGLEIFLRKKQFDLVHIMVPGKLCRTVAGIAEEKNIPWVVSCRSEFFKCVDAVSGTRRDNAHGRFMSNFKLYGESLQKASKVLCDDHQLRRYMAEKLGDRSVLYFPGAVAYERFSQPAKVDFRKFYQLPDGKNIILTVGHLSRDKNQKMLLDVLNILKHRSRNCHLVIIGWNHNDGYAEEIKRLTDEYKLNDSVTVIPGLPPEDERFRAAFQASALVLLPARYGVSASAVLEAWAAGVPVVVSPVGAGMELIDDNISGRFASPRDFRQWVKCCEELLDERNRGVLEKLRAAGLQQARKSRWEKRLDELKKIYDEVINYTEEI